GSAILRADRLAQQVASTGQALMQSQRLAKSVSQALVGSAQAFPDVRESADVLAKTVRGLKDGDQALRLSPVSNDLQGDVEKITPFMERAEKNAATVMSQQNILTQVGNALRTINRQSSDLLEIAETVSSLKLQQNAPSADISASGQLVMLTQRIGKSANEFLTMEGVSPEAVFLLGKDLNSFREIAQGLKDGSPELRLAGSTDPQTREQLDALMALYEQTRVQAGAILGNLQGLVSAREAQASIIADSEPMRRGLEDIQGGLASQSGLGLGSLTALVVAAIFGLLCAMGIARVQLQDSRQRQSAAERQQLEARGQEQDAKRVNDANQAAILRLMNELQTVAEGDLTQEATVTEDITGAIADSVNYTVEELRQLVGNVQN
ncbi:MAG: methyl-accepting chemotaxis protein, partial [Haliea sp.]